MTQTNLNIVVRYPCTCTWDTGMLHDAIDRCREKMLGVRVKREIYVKYLRECEACDMTSRI